VSQLCRAWLKAALVAAKARLTASWTKMRWLVWFFDHVFEVELIRPIDRVDVRFGAPTLV